MVPPWPISFPQRRSCRRPGSLQLRSVNASVVLSLSLCLCSVQWLFLFNMRSVEWDTHTENKRRDWTHGPSALLLVCVKLRLLMSFLVYIHTKITGNLAPEKPSSFQKITIVYWQSTLLKWQVCQLSKFLLWTFFLFVVRLATAVVYETHLAAHMYSKPLCWSIITDSCPSYTQLVSPSISRPGPTLPWYYCILVVDCVELVQVYHIQQCCWGFIAYISFPPSRTFNFWIVWFS